MNGLCLKKIIRGEWIMAHVKPLCCNKKTWQQGSTGGWMAEMTESERRYFYLHIGGNFNAPLSAQNHHWFQGHSVVSGRCRWAMLGRWPVAQNRAFLLFLPISTSGLVLILNIHLTRTLILIQMFHCPISFLFTGCLQSSAPKI